MICHQCGDHYDGRCQEAAQLIERVDILANDKLILETQLAEARATKDMHKERQQQEILRADALLADRNALRRELQDIHGALTAIVDDAVTPKDPHFSQSYVRTALIAKARAALKAQS